MPDSQFEMRNVAPDLRHDYDLSPLPLRPFDSNALQFEQEHTSRNNHMDCIISNTTIQVSHLFRRHEYESLGEFDDPSPKGYKGSIIRFASCTSCHLA